MTRAEFMGRLRRGLVGMPTATAADIASDYEIHFEDGLAAGRSEAEVAAGEKLVAAHGLPMLCRSLYNASEFITIY